MTQGTKDALRERLTRAPTMSRTVEQLEHSVKSAEAKLSGEVMARLDAIWQGPGEAPEAYAW